MPRDDALAHLQCPAQGLPDGLGQSAPVDDGVGGAQIGHRRRAEPDGNRLLRLIDQHQQRLPRHGRDHQFDQALHADLRIEGCAQLPAGFGQEFGSAFVVLGDPLRGQGLDQGHPLLGLTPRPLLHEVQIDEDLHLAAEHLGYHRREDVVDGAERVSAGRLHLVGVGRHEDDRRMRGPVVLTDERSGLEAVDVGHVDVEQDDRELVAQHFPQRVVARAH